MRRVLAVLALTLMSLVPGGPASAGGPTSVLLVVPGTGQTASLYVTDPDYSALAGLVGADESFGGAKSTGAGHESGTSVTVTWLIHDVQVWRVDRVYLAAEGGPWIATQSTTDGSAAFWDTPVAWHVAPEGAELEALLDRLGVGSAGKATRAVAPAALAPTPGAGDSREEGTSVAPWALAGLIVGVALTLMWTRWRRASNAAAGEPATTLRQRVLSAD